MGTTSSVGVYFYVILTESDLVAAIHADEHGCRRWYAWFWWDRDPFCNVGEDVADVGRVGDVFEECRIGVAGGRGAEVGDDGLKGTFQGIQKSGDVIVVGFAVSGVVRADLDGV